MKDAGIFTVIIPVYNKVKYIKHAVESVLNQTFQNYEIIIIDDASTDGSEQIISEFKDSRIRILTRERPGPAGYAARNYGISESHCEWITFLDADDHWRHNHLCIAYDLVRNYPGCSFFNLGRYNHRNGDYIRISHDSEEVLASQQGLALLSKIDIFHTNSVVVRKSVIKEVGGFPEYGCRRGGDTDLWLRLLLHVDTVVMSPAITSYYEQDRSSVLSNPDNLSETHPVLHTIREALNDDMSNEEKRILKKLANRKSFSWSLERKRHGLSVRKDLLKYYPGVFSFGDIRKYLKLAMKMLRC